MQIDAKKIAMDVRVMGEMLEGYRRAVGDGMTVAEELRSLVEINRAMIQAFVDSLAAPNRIWQANNFTDIIESLEAGQELAGMTREQWLEIREAFDAFMTWANTPLADSGVSPMTVISRRPA